MKSPDQQPMRYLIIAGTYAQYRDWLVRNRANPKAALYIHRGEQLCGFDPADCIIELVGSYHDNEAFMSEEYVYFTDRQRRHGMLAPVAQPAM